MGNKLFDVHEMKEYIRKAAFEATANYVGISDRFLSGEDDEPTFYLSSPSMLGKEEVRSIFLDTLIPYVHDDCICHAIVLPRVKVITMGTLLIKIGDWVYG